MFIYFLIACLTLVYQVIILCQLSRWLSLNDRHLLVCAHSILLFSQHHHPVLIGCFIFFDNMHEAENCTPL